MDGTFIYELASRLRAPSVEKVNGVKYLVVPDENGNFKVVEGLPQKTPLPTPLALSTLESLCEYVKTRERDARRPDVPPPLDADGGTPAVARALRGGRREVEARRRRVDQEVPGRASARRREGPRVGDGREGDGRGGRYAGVGRRTAGGASADVPGARSCRARADSCRHPALQSLDGELRARDARALLGRGDARVHVLAPRATRDRPLPPDDGGVAGPARRQAPLRGDADAATRDELLYGVAA